MNVWQLCRHLRYLLLARTWAGTGSAVFGSGSVFCSETLPSDFQVKGSARLPCALVYPTEATSDPQYNEEPDLIQQNIIITVIGPAIPGDSIGEKALIGGNVPDRTKSEGRGLLEFEPEIKSAVGRLLPDNGVSIAFHTASASKPVIDATLGYLHYRDYTFKAWLTQDRIFPPARYLVATGGSGQVALTWTVPADRYDRYRVVLRRASGSTAPASITTGTGVTLSGNLATSVTNTSLAAGTYSYSLFATYDESSATPDSDDEVSSAVTRTGVSVS